MSYDRIGNYRIRWNGRKISIFDKVHEIKIDLKRILPEVADDRLIMLFSSVRSYYVSKKKGIPQGRKGKKGHRKLTEIEELLYSYLIKNGLNPATTYRWFLATRLPSDIKQKLIKGQIGQKQAMQVSANRRRTKNSTEGLLLLEEIRTIVQKLDWRG